MEYFPENIIFIFLSINLFLICGIGWIFNRKIVEYKIIIDVIYYFVFIKITLYYFIPTLLRIISGYKFEIEDNINLNYLIEIYLIENISWIFWTLGLYFTLKLTSSKNKNQLIDNRINDNKKHLALIIACGYIILQLFVIANIEIPALLEPYKSLFYFGGLTVGPFLLAASLRYFGKLYFMIGIICTSLSIITTSTRGILVYIILFLLFLYFHIMKNKKIFYFSLTILVTISMLYFFSGGLIKAEINRADDSEGSLVINVDSEKKGGRSALEEVEWRFGAASRIGTAFIKLYDDGYAAGINPILHSFQGALPRSVFPDKPHPSTLIGDDIYSQGMYIIHKEVYGSNSVSMVEFPTGGHFYWEFGYMGVIFLSIISGFYIGISTFICKKLGLLSIPIIITCFKPWGYTDPKIWISDAIIQVYQIWIPLFTLIFIMYLYKKIHRLKKYKFYGAR